MDHRDLHSFPTRRSSDLIRSANPSAIADFPTPGSPISNGLFFLRLLNICDTRCISSSRPITGSSFPSMASARSEEHTSELQSRGHLVCRLLLEKKKILYL